MFHRAAPMMSAWMAVVSVLLPAVSASAVNARNNSLISLPHGAGFPGQGDSLLSARGQCECSSCDPNNDPAVITIGYYSDANCQNELKTVVYNAYGDSPSGCASCDPGLLPTGPSFFGKVKSGNDGVQADLTRDQVCPPGGPDAVIATFDVGSPTCIQLQGITGEEGMAVYGAGGAILAKKRAEKRDTQSCSGFTVTSQQNTYTASQQVSDTVNCQNSAAPCTISRAQQHTTSITSSYSATAGFDIEGISASVTFGQDYTDSESTTLQDTFSVPVNQEGFLTTYSAATLFQGTFTGCPDGDVPGEALVPKANGVTYQVTLTNQ
ncbi:hypothetical protein OC846_006151 [Tilletia horrida]|uniref:Uncharacterized protein n=1 Tax=Tilletia horrida TaxID=155126 RepID=A0AAN6GJE3_9BASI|nr:hypothetical protein OC846_006151 [Tilletia horrida]KAK0546163.1 hypothetical protein OC845_004730 [Tilletia horrida]KAK0560376.1 hypothetical protein OC861_006304 [Tilletia horrida]